MVRLISNISLADDDVYVIECNVRASRSFPFVSKAYGINLIEAATNVVLGKNLNKIPQLGASLRWS